MATAKLALYAISSKTGQQMHSARAQHGQSYFTRWKILLLISWNTTDIPEVGKTKY